MSISKEEMINSVYKKYGVRFFPNTGEKILLDVYSGKYHVLEVKNLAKRGKVSKFGLEDMRSVSTDDLRRLAQKYAKVTLPPNLPRSLIINILLKKLDAKKLSDKELEIFGRSGRSTLTDAISLYGGLIPGVRRKIKKRDIKRGKKEVKKF